VQPLGHFENERCPIVARVNAKTIYAVRHLYLTSDYHDSAANVANSALFSHFQTKTPCHFVTQSIKITSHVVHFRSEKNKKIV